MFAAFNMFPEAVRPFNTMYRCYSVSMLPGNERSDVEKGGKIIMPPSALDHLTRLNIEYPMLFRLTNVKTNRITHCGVLEFVADEGKVYLPYWMMTNLLLSDEGEMIRIESTSLPVAVFSKFQPQSVEFLDITNPKAVLENALRNFACLTAGDVIAIDYNNKVYELCVLETQPGDAVSIIECDMNVEFAAPVGYRDQTEEPEASNDSSESDVTPLAVAKPLFPGSGHRLDGKAALRTSTSDMSTTTTPILRGIPDYEYQIGTIRFIRMTPRINETKSNPATHDFQAFKGTGQTLHSRKK